MLLNIDAPVKRDEIKKVLEESTDVKYTFKGNANGRMSVLQFEVDETSVEGSPVAFTKTKLKSALGNLAVFRVLEDGKNW